MTRVFSDDMTRMVDDAPALALAGYAVRSLDEMHFEARHVGIFESHADALSWVKTGEPQPHKIFELEIP